MTVRIARSMLSVSKIAFWTCAMDSWSIKEDEAASEAPNACRKPDAVFFARSATSSMYFRELTLRDKGLWPSCCSCCAVPSSMSISSATQSRNKIATMAVAVRTAAEMISLSSWEMPGSTVMVPQRKKSKENQLMLIPLAVCKLDIVREYAEVGMAFALWLHLSRQ